MSAPRQTSAPSGKSAAERARMRLRPAQTTSHLCTNPRPCRYGDCCKFAHSAEEQRLFWEAQPEGAGVSYKEREGATGVYGQPYCHPDKYKTSLCIHWDRQGDCRHGASCNFAHGQAELRPQPSYQRPSYSRGSYSSGHSGASSGVKWGSPHQQLPADEVPEFDEEAAAAAAAAAAAYPEAYRLQLEFDQQRQAACAAAAAGVGAASTPAGQQAPAIHSQDEFPALGGASGGAKSAAAGDGCSTRASKAGTEAGGACMGAGIEWDDHSVASAGSMPATVELGEGSLAGLVTSSSDGSCGASVRSMDAAEQEEAGVLGALRSMHLSVPSTVPSASPSMARPTKQACEEKKQGQEGEEAQQAQQEKAQQRQQEEAHHGAAGVACQSWADMADDEEQEAERAQQAQQQPEQGASVEQQPWEDAPPAGPAAPPPPPLASSAAPPRVLFSGPPSPSRVHGGTMPPIAASRPMAPPPGFARPAGARPLQPPPLPAAAPPAPTPCQPPLPPTAAAAPAPATPVQLRPPCDARAALLQRFAGPRGVDLSLVPAFLCPLTGQPFAEPVVAADGFTYEKEVITDWLYRQNKEVSPMTGRQLPHRLLLPNDALRTAMGQVAELIRALTG